MKYDRLLEMEKYIKENKSITIEQLLNVFNISIQTLRRDLNELENKGTIKKVYGGVIYNDHKVIDIAYREISLLEAKKRIGHLASSLIRNNDVIFIDSGTTACQIVPFIKNKKGVIVITHSLLVLKEIEDRNDLKVILMSGEYRYDTKSFIFDFLKLNYNFNLAFISSVGVDLKIGFSNNDYYEGEVKKAIIANSKKVCMLADHSKLGKLMFNNFAFFNDVNYFITDQKLPNEYAQVFKKYKIMSIYD